MFNHLNQPLLPSIPGYILTEELYVGKYSTVYRALVDDHSQAGSVAGSVTGSVVIKVLQSYSSSIHDLVRFRNQYIIAKSLTSPGIVKPLALESWQGHYALVMEDVGGVALREHLQSCGSLTVQTVLETALQLADILHYLSQHRVLHKDIKPANILIHPDTHQIWLTDFSLASLLPKESQSLQNPRSLEGTLAYMAPEQTGRMNRGIDYRADFYSLGVTLYELLTGVLPFQSENPMELIHCHIAKTPPNLSSSIPRPVFDIALKLMAKTAEDRYQSALGLKHDLQRCLSQWKAYGQIESFELGQQDHCDRILIPEKLYGREADVQTLLDAFERVSQGTSELMLVAGYSGVGKTAVVNEVHKPIVEKRGYFIKGKYDQFNRNIPFSAFVHAFRDLISQLLGESDVQLQAWKDKILNAVGDHGQVLIEVIPELEIIIGQQPPAPELSGSAVQNRFNLLFEKFIAVFATIDHPLVILLDDLQWVDSASLNLLKLLMGGTKTKCLLVLGAYRDNEVSASHPLMQTLDELEHSSPTLQTIMLSPLKQCDIHQLVAESLHCSVESATPLAQLVYQKAQGNPFFTTQFLQGLQADGWITFNAETGHWQCDLSKIRSLALTNDVLAFMVSRLQQWPQPTQNALAIAACLGNQFELATLAAVCEQPSEELAQLLWPALKTGLIIPENETYKFFQGRDNPQSTNQLISLSDVAVTYRFLHDQVQQAAYSSIPEQQKEVTHYQVGRFLLERLPSEKRDAYIFDIVNQFNIGQRLISQTDERHQLISLNFRAGIKAKSATAYEVALGYFDTAIALLSEDGWTQNYPLALTLHENAAETAYLSGDEVHMETILQTVLAQASSKLDTVKTLQIKMQSCLGQNKPLASIEIARNLLRDLGVFLPDAPNIKDVQQELESFKRVANQVSCEQIIALPTLTDPEKLAVVSTLMLVVPPTMIAKPNLFFLIVIATNKLSLEYGNSPYSPYAWSTWAMLLKTLEQDMEAAYEWGNIALRLLKRSDKTVWENRVYQAMSAFIMHGKRHVKETLDVLEYAYTSGLENGDFEFSAYAIFVKCYHLYLLGCELSEVKRAILKAYETLENLRQNLPASWLKGCYQTLAQLSNPEYETNLPMGDTVAVNAYIHAKQEQGDAFGLCYFYANQAAFLYILGDYPRALVASELTEQYIAGPAGMLVEVIFYFYNSLINLACVDDIDDSSSILAKVRENQQKMEHWAHHAPMNFKHKYELICAEEQRVLGNRLAAIEAYDCAIAGAQTNGYLQEQAIANELAAKFYLDWGKEKIAAAYMQEAYHCYEQWGAKTKTLDMESRYADLLQPILAQRNAIDPLITLHNITPLNLSVHCAANLSQPSTKNLNLALDLATLFKSAQALSETVNLDELLEKLTPMLLQTSGAERLALLLPDADVSWQIRVSSTPEGTQMVSTPLADHPNLPVRLIQYVLRTQEILAVNELDQALPVVDPYLQQHPHCSVLCMPLLYQSRLIGLLYLEHQSVSRVFGQDRLTILNFLCTQAAISLENALLHQALTQQLEVQTAKCQVSETRFRNIVDNIPGVVYQAHSTSDGKISFSYISPNCHDLYEVPAEAFMSGEYHLRDFEHSEDRPIIDQMLSEAIPKKQPFEHEFRIVTPSGTLKWVHAINSFAYTLSDGSVIRDGLVMDVSDRKKLEKEKDRLIQILQATSDFIGICKPQKGVLWQNQAFRNLRPDLNVFEEDVPISVLYPQWAYDIVKNEGLQTAIQQGIWSGETALLTTSGEELPTSQVIIAHKSDTDEVEYFSTILRDISDRKVSELALKDAQAQLSRLTESIPGMVFRYVLHPDGSNQFTYVSAHIRELYELEPEDVLRQERSPWELVHPDDVAYLTNKIQESAQTLQPILVEHRFILPSGHVRWGQNIGRPERQENGDTVWHGVSFDITDRKEAEAHLKSVSERLELAIESADIGIWEWNSADNRLIWNDRMFVIYGVAPEDFTGQYEEWSQRLHPDDAERMTQQEAQTLYEQGEATAEFKIIRPDHQIRYIYSNVIAQRNEQGDLVKMIGLNVDITNRKSAENALVLKQNHLEALLNNIPQIAWIKDEQSRFIAVNHPFAQASGTSAEDLVGKTDYDIWPAELAQSYRDDDSQVLQSGQRKIVEEPISRSDGTSGWIETTKTPFRDHQGVFVGTVGIAADITERKNYEQELKRLSERLELAIASAQLGTWEWSSERACLSWDERMFEIYGVQPEEFKGTYQDWAKRVHPKDLIQYEAGKRVRDQNCAKEYTQEYRIIRPDGTTRYILATGLIERDEQGKTSRMVGTNLDITERKVAELALKDAQAQFRRMTENVPGMIYRYVLHPDGSDDLTYVSSQSREIFELEPEIALQDMTQVWARIHPDDIPWLGEAIQSSADRLQPFTGAYRLVLPEKGLRWAQNMTRVERLDNGDVVWDGIVMDVTERKHYEQEILEAKTFLQTILDTCHLSIFWKDRECRYISANQNFIRDAGFDKAEDIAGLTDFDMPWSTAEAESFRADDQKVMMSDTPKLGILQTQINADGTQAWLDTNKLPLHDFDGNVIGVLAVYQDISDRKQAELALAQEVLRRTTIFNTSSDGIHIIDLQGNLLEANTSFYRMLGYTAAETKQLNVCDWDAQWSQEEIEEILQNYARDTSLEILTFETLHRRKDKSIFPAEISVCSMTWNGQVSLVCIARDISERKQSEAQLQRTNAELMRATRLKDEFLANMSHELRTPLNSILGLSEAMQEEVFGPLTEPQLKYLKVIEQSGTHLLSLINDILDVSKIESGKLELDVTPVDVVSLCEASMAFVKQQALTKRISVSREMPFSSLTLLIDERRILQSLVNLLNNAVKFTAEGGCVVLSVSCHQRDDNREMMDDQSTVAQSTVREEQPPNRVMWESGILNARAYITLSVRDTGIGISPEHLKKLFKPFSQIDSSLNRKYSGTGLGLVLVKQIAELHGGTVSLNSEVGVGSCFSINLPYTPNLSLQSKQTVSDEVYPLSLPTNAKQGESPLILLAEDNENNVDLTVSYLENRGYRLVVASNGLEAIKLAKTHLPDVILMDIQMPELDGLESIRQIRQEPQLKLTPIIALTALAMEGDQARCLAAGANLYHSKPVQLKALVLSIQQLLAE